MYAIKYENKNRFLRNPYSELFYIDLIVIFYLSKKFIIKTVMVWIRKGVHYRSLLLQDIGIPVRPLLYFLWHAVQVQRLWFCWSRTFYWPTTLTDDHGTSRSQLKTSRGNFFCIFIFIFCSQVRTILRLLRPKIVLDFGNSYSLSTGATTSIYKHFIHLKKLQCLSTKWSSTVYKLLE